MWMKYKQSFTYKLHGQCVSINVHQGPEWRVSGDPREEHPFILAIDPVHDLALPREVEEQDISLIRIPLQKSLSPIPGLVCQIWTGVSG